MKKVLTVIFLTGLYGFVNAQSDKEQIDMIQSMYGMEKKAIVAEFIELDGEKGDNFWNLYDEYETKRKELGKQRIALLERYAENYMDLDDETTASLLTDMMTLRKSTDKLVEGYVKKVKKTVDVKTAAKFYQIEEFFVSKQRSVILENIPVIGELD